MKARDRLKRRLPYRNPKLRFLIVCEGVVTEKHYFLSTRHLLRSLIELEVIPGGDPKKLVEIAVEKKGSSERNDGSFAYDQVWCVYDVDDHKRLPDARQQARAHGIHLAISNPMF